MMVSIDELVDLALADSSRRLAAYRTETGIVRFVRDVLGAEPADYQEDILRMLVRYKRVAVRGPHGLGKTALAAWFTLWLIACFEHDTKVPTTASKWRQLIYFLWPEIKKWSRNANWSAIGIDLRYGKELLERSIKLPDKEAFALASDDPSAIEGAHATTLGYVFDEAKAIPSDIWDAAEGAFSAAGDDTTSDAYALAISTPGETSGRFYEIHQRKPGTEDWAVRHVTLEEAIAAGRISRQWAEQRKRQWGEQSAVYKNRVKGEFDDSGETNVIPLSWVEAANDRWLDCKGIGEGKTSYGVDPARFGIDRTCMGRLVGSVLEEVRYYEKQDTMQTVGRVIAFVHGDKAVPIGVDVIGIGAGVHDRLKEQRYKSIAVNVAHKTTATDESGEIGFVNIRSEIWWMLRKALDPSGDIHLALPPDDLLTGDLTAPTYEYTSDGKIKVESKDDIRARIGRSTDAADMLGLAYYAGNKPRGWVIR
jgi:hypothetical protein